MQPPLRTSSGSSTGGGCFGLNANDTANNCTGSSSAGSGCGLNADTANNCTGSSTGSGSCGLTGNNANNCHGLNTGGGYGVLLQNCANNCPGVSIAASGSIGIEATVAIGCFCSGFDSDIYAEIANSCYSANGKENIQNKYNMP